MTEILLGALLIIALYLVDFAHFQRHNRYRQAWQRASTLLTAADEARDQARLEARNARISYVGLQRYTEKLEGELRDLGAEFSSLEQLGQRLVIEKAERDRAAAAQRAEHGLRQALNRRARMRS